MSQSPAPLSSLERSWAEKHVLQSHSNLPYWFGKDAQAGESMGRPSIESAIHGEADAIQAGISEAGIPIPNDSRDTAHACQTPKLES